MTAKNISGQICTIHTTNADAFLDSVTGMIEYESKGGDLTAAGVVGYGNFQATGDGGMEIKFADVTGTLSARTKNGRITLALPDSLDFEFTASTQNGSIDTSFSELLSMTDKTASGTIGGNAKVRIGLETKDGDINVTR